MESSYGDAGLMSTPPVSESRRLWGACSLQAGVFYFGGRGHDPDFLLDWPYFFLFRSVGAGVHIRVAELQPGTLALVLGVR